MVWRDWYNKAHVKTIQKAEVELERKGEILNDLSRELKEKQEVTRAKKGKLNASERWKVTGVQAEAMIFVSTTVGM